MAVKISIHWFSFSAIIYVTVLLHSLFVFADDGEDDNEHKTDGDGDE